MEEKKIVSSKEFTKLLGKQIFINSIFVGFVLYFISELSKEFLPFIAIIIINCILLFLAVTKIYMNSIKETFYKCKINRMDIEKITKNIAIIFCVLFIFSIVLDFVTYFNSMKMAKIFNMENILLISLIINIVGAVIIYTITGIACRKKFLEEASKEENII